MDASVIGSIIASAGFTSVVGVIINAVVTRRRVGAEATEIITKAAGGMVERLNTEAAGARAELVEERRQREECEARLRTQIQAEVRKREALERRFDRERVAWRHILQVHAAWDVMALQRISTPIGMPPLPAPPPLTPPTRASDFADDDEG